MGKFILAVSGSPVDAGVTKYDPLEPLYSSSSEISEDSESLSSFTLHAFEGEMLSKQSLMEGMCHMPCLCDPYCC